MKRVLKRLLASLTLLALPAAALAADATVDTTTFLRFNQDSRSGFTSRDLAPATQFLGVDVNKLADGNLSAHFFGWGRVDLLDKSFNDDRASGTLNYGYLEYRFGAANAKARAGRFFVHEGIVNEQVDGVSARTDLPYGFGLSAFGGATVRTAHLAGQASDGKGDALYGGRLNYRYGGLLELGLSGVYETKAPVMTDPTLAPFFGDHRVVGADLWFSPFRTVQLLGHSSYNAATSHFADHGYLLQVRPFSGLTVAGEFNEYRDRDFFYSSALFATLPSMLSGNNLNQLSRTFGGSASYLLGGGYEISADAKHYSRDIGKADRVGGELRLILPEGALRCGLGYHYLVTGEQFALIPGAGASGTYHEMRAFAMRDTRSYFASLDAIDYLFKKEIDAKLSAFELAGSLGYHLTPSLSLSGDLSYGSNPQYNDEFKGLVRLSYTTKIAGKGETR